MPTSTAHRIAVVVAGSAAGLADLTLVLAAVLSFRYVPSGAQAWDDPSLGAGGTAWTAGHTWSAVLWLLAAAVTAVVLVRPSAVAGDRRLRAVGLGGALLSGIGALVVLLTRSLVQWDQLALFAVTVGDGTRGFWAALDDGVRFVLVDGVEVAPGSYGVALAVHLIAHVVGSAGAVMAVVALARDRRESRSQEATGAPTVR